MPTAEASTCTKNYCSKSELWSTGDTHKCLLKETNAFSLSSVHLTGFLAALMARLVRGTATEAKLGMIQLYHPTSPKKDLSCFLVQGCALLIISTLST